MSPPKCRYVLLVDDNRVSLSIMKKMFENAGWCVICAISFNQAIQVWDTNPHIQLMVIDFVFDLKYNGADLAANVRRDERESQIPLDQQLPLVCVSAHNAKEKFMQAGGTEFISKPLTIADVQRLTTTYGG